MTKKTSPKAVIWNEWRDDDWPVVGELKDCRQLSDDHWQGTHADGTIIDVHGGRMPERLIVPL